MQFQYAGTTPVHPAVHIVRPRGAFAQLISDLIWMAAAAFAVALITVAILYGGQLAKAGRPGVIIAGLIALVIALAWAAFVDRLRAAAAERTIALIEQAVRSGLPLPEFLRTAATTEPFLVARGLRTIHTLLHHGVPLPAAFAKAYPRVPGWIIDSLDLPPGGSLARSIAELRSRQQREHATQLLSLGKAHGHMVFTLLAFCFVATMFAVFVLPSFLRIAIDFKLRSIWIDRMVSVGRFFDSVWGVLVVVLVCTLVLAWIARTLAAIAASRYGAPVDSRGPISRLVLSPLSRLTWRLPMVGVHQRDVAWADFFGRLANHVGAATPLPDAVQSASSGATSRGVIDSADRIAARLRSGSSLAAACEATPDFPHVATGLLASATTPGQLSSTARLLSDRFGERAVRRAEVVRSVLPVVATLLLSAVVVPFILMVLMTMVDLINGAMPMQFKVMP
jgi:type II secretory pathway component PulF